MTEEINLAHIVLQAMESLKPDVGQLGGRILKADEIASSARRLAAQLKNAGSEPGEPVVLFTTNEINDLVGFLGVWLAGCVAVPIHAVSPEASSRALIDRLGARFTIRGGALSQLGVDAPTPRQLLTGAAFIVFTSGSTGSPKGVVIGHAGMAWKLGVLSKLLKLQRSDVVAVPLQLTFIFGIWASLLALTSGSRLLLAPKFTAQAAGSHAEQITVLAAVPTALRAIVADENFSLPLLNKVLSGGEPLRLSVAQSLEKKFSNTCVFDLFGLTETGSCDFCAKSGDQPESFGTIGRPTEGLAFKIVENVGLKLPAGVGELQIETPARMLGYLDDPAQTNEVFDGGYVRTGDLATISGDGYVKLVGRLKDIVSRGGNKIAPMEVESIFASHEAIASVLAFGMPDEKYGECLHLMVVLRDIRITEQDLRAWASDRIERYKIPDRFHFVDAIPAGRTGKVDRGAARRLVEQRVA